MLGAMAAVSSSSSSSSPSSCWAVLFERQRQTIAMICRGLCLLLPLAAGQVPTSSVSLPLAQVSSHRDHRTARLLALLSHRRERRACAPVAAHEEARQLLPGAGSSSSQAPGPPAAFAASRGHGIVWDRSEFGLLPVDGSRGHLSAPLDALIKYRLTHRTSHLAPRSGGKRRWT